MIFEQYFEQYFEKLDRIGYTGTDKERELLVDSLFRMYQTTGRAEYRELAEKLWDKKQGRASLHLWEAAGQEHYLEAARREEERIKMVSPEDCDPGQLEDMLSVLPFYMEWDVMFGGKAHLNEIVHWFQKLEKLQEDTNLPLHETAVLEALLGCACAVPEEAYDLYRYLGNYLKKEIKRLLLQRNRETGLLETSKHSEIRESAALSEAVLAGCRMGFLSKERYEKAGKELLAAVALKGFTLQAFQLIPREKGQEAACIKAWSEYKRLCQNSGR